MLRSPFRVVLALALAAGSSSLLPAQSPALFGEMHWRDIGPTRAGRTRALDGVAQQPNLFYIGFDNGGVWRTTDYGSTWMPIFDDQPTSSIGAIAVAPSDPNIIYVGSGGGIIRPDLSVGDGMYKSTDAGATWTHLGLRESQMIADVVVDPTNPDRLFVAVLGHPYGPNEERGVFRSLDGGRTFEKVLYRDAYTSANDLLMDPSDPNTVYATLWQQQSYQEGAAFGSAGNGIYKSTDGGTTWRPLTQGLPSVIEANLALAPSNPTLLYAMVAGTPKPVAGEGAGRDGGTTGVVGFYKSTDAGEHWIPVDVPPGPLPEPTAHVDTRPLARIGGGNLPTITVDPKNENVIYSATVVLWRSDDGGVHWTAIRGAYGGDDYQKLWINPNNPDILLAVSDQGAVISANHGVSWSNWYTQPTAAMYHVTADNGFPYRLCGGQQDSGSACVKSRSDDGNIQVTMDAGASWRNVTPPAIKPWTRIFNIEAGHFDNRTAYAAANTMRIDDMNPHFWRTHDGGTTWTEINTGIAPGVVANSIREDPRTPGLLYAATETQVWVSFDDGDRWQSPRLDMPAVSVRDIQVKDDSTCMCSDLVAGTHGRGFWILDNVTPLRQAAEAAAASTAFLYKPATAVRVRFGMNPPTEWTPELPAGENPMPGAIIDYYLPRDVAGPVQLDILDASGVVIRSLSSDDPRLDPDPALDPVAYDRICQADPTFANCRQPLYWPAPQMLLSTKQGMHRFSWDMHFEPLDDEPRAGGGATGAVPGHTYPSVDAPWAPAGEYTARLTVAGQRFTQPLSVRMDPRVQTTSAHLAQIAALSREMYDGAIAASAACTEARTLVSQLAARGGTQASALKTRIEALAPEAPASGAAGRFRAAAGAPTLATLATLSQTMMSAAMPMQDADVAPTTRQVAAVVAARAQFVELMARWETLRQAGQQL